MNKNVLEQLGLLIRETFGEPDAFIARETVAMDIPGWDSLSHTILIMSVEEQFGVELTPGMTFANVGELVDEIASKLSSR